MKNYTDFVAKNGATDLNVYFSLCIAEEYKKAKKNNERLSVKIETSGGKITEIHYQREKSF